jgi:outer membrane protein insertion porin family
MKSLVACAPEANPGCLPNLDTPIVERFFAGGRTTHRAFTLDDLGVPGQTLQDGQGIGGNALLLANVEWRVPLSGGLGLVLFADWGNVWAGPTYLKLADGRWGAGLGLHYLTPVGPFRLEYGFRLDRAKDEDAGALSFSIGYPF